MCILLFPVNAGILDGNVWSTKNSQLLVIVILSKTNRVNYTKS